MSRKSEQELLQLERKYCSFGDTVHYLEPPKSFERSEGSYLYDRDGTPYLDDDWTGHNGFRSKHVSGVQFARCDASIAYVHNHVSLAVYRAQCTVAGKETLPANW